MTFDILKKETESATAWLTLELQRTRDPYRMLAVLNEHKLHVDQLAKVADQMVTELERGE